MNIYVTLQSDDRDLVTVVFDDRTEPLIGRDKSTADLVLHSKKVSRVHARLVWRGENVVVQDLKSRHGTYVDGKRVTREAPLWDGVSLQVGDFRLRIGLAKKAFKLEEEETQMFLLCRTHECGAQLDLEFSFCPRCGQSTKG